VFGGLRAADTDTGQSEGDAEQDHRWPRDSEQGVSEQKRGGASLRR
jgi:hypothetical protein